MASTDQILDAALGIVQTQGLSALTIDAVAQKAAFSKGGVLYHFPSKERLISGLISRFVRGFENDLEAHLERDSGASGAWTRAYIRAALGSRVRGAELFATLSSALTVDPGLLAPLRERYRHWQQRLENDGLPAEAATMVRMACEGLWLCDVLDLGAPDAQVREQTIELLLRISQTTQIRATGVQEGVAMAGMEWIFPVASDPRRYQNAVLEQTVERSLERAERLREAVAKAGDVLRGMQTAEGFWCGALTADSTLQSDYVLFQLWLHPPQGGAWNPPVKDRIAKAARSILREQLADGGWPIYPDGPSEVNASVKAYVALKLAGHRADAPEMAKARERILALGGVQECNSYVKINLSLFGLYPRNHVPSVPPEIMLVPGGVLYEMSSWTRTIVVPLSIVQASGDVRPVPDGFDVEEIFHPAKKLALPRREGLAVLFHHLDRLVKLWERRGPKNLRQSALREAERWILERTRHSEGLGAIYPAMMYHIMALQCLGYADDHPDLVEAMRHFDNLLLETEDSLVFQPAVSPVWDTAYGAFALAESGTADEAELMRAADWLISKEIRRKGDWAVKRPNLEPSGWAFEFANEYYPDIDDTAAVLLALHHASGSDVDKQRRCVRRAVQWLVGMQSEDGGWAAFDADNNWQILNKVPFADHNAMLDPTCPDITGRVLDALCRYGYSLKDEPVRRGVDFLLKTQEKNGSWYGRWGVNYLYGTFLALRGLAAASAVEATPQLERAARWVRSIQNRDGGWGESCASYLREHFVPGPSTASQTAWALLALHAAGDRDSSALHRGVEYLLTTQEDDGTWEEHLATGTGFPNVFFLTYHLYRQYFPLLALGTVAKMKSQILAK